MPANDGRRPFFTLAEYSQYLEEAESARTEEELRLEREREQRMREVYEGAPQSYTHEQLSQMEAENAPDFLARTAMALHDRLGLNKPPEAPEAATRRPGGYTHEELSAMEGRGPQVWSFADWYAPTPEEPNRRGSPGYLETLGGHIMEPPKALLRTSGHIAGALPMFGDETTRRLTPAGDVPGESWYDETGSGMPPYHSRLAADLAGVGPAVYGAGMEFIGDLIGSETIETIGRESAEAAAKFSRHLYQLFDVDDVPYREEPYLAGRFGQRVIDSTQRAYAPNEDNHVPWRDSTIEGVSSLVDFLLINRGMSIAARPVIRAGQSGRRAENTADQLDARLKMQESSLAARAADEAGDAAGVGRHMGEMRQAAARLDRTDFVQQTMANEAVRNANRAAYAASAVTAMAMGVEEGMMSVDQVRRDALAESAVYDERVQDFLREVGGIRNLDNVSRETLARAFRERFPDMKLSQRDLMHVYPWAGIAGWIQIATLQPLLRKWIPEGQRGMTTVNLMKRMAETGLTEFTVESFGAIVQNEARAMYDEDHPINDMVWERGAMAGGGAVLLQVLMMPFLRRSAAQGKREGSSVRIYQEALGKERWYDVLGVERTASPAAVAEQTTARLEAVEQGLNQGMMRPREAKKERERINAASELANRAMVGRATKEAEDVMWSRIAAARRAGIPDSAIAHLYFDTFGTYQGFEQVASRVGSEMQRRRERPIDAQLSEAVDEARIAGVPTEQIREILANTPAGQGEFALWRVRKLVQPKADQQAVEAAAQGIGAAEASPAEQAAPEQTPQRTTAHENTEEGRLASKKAAYAFYYEKSSAEMRTEDARVTDAGHQVVRAQEKANKHGVPMNLWAGAPGARVDAIFPATQGSPLSNGRLIATFYPESSVVQDSMEAGAAEADAAEKPGTTTTAESDVLDRARAGDADAQKQLQNFGLSWDGNKPKYRLTSKGEVDRVLGGETVVSNRGHGVTDVTTNPEYAKVDYSSNYRIKFKQSPRFDTDRTETSDVREKNVKEQEYHLRDGYSLEDIQTVEVRNDDGTWSVVYSADASEKPGTTTTAAESEFNPLEALTVGDVVDVMEAFSGDIAKAARYLGLSPQEAKTFIEKAPDVIAKAASTPYSRRAFLKAGVALAAKATVGIGKDAPQKLPVPDDFQTPEKLTEALSELKTLTEGTFPKSKLLQMLRLRKLFGFSLGMDETRKVVYDGIAQLGMEHLLTPEQAAAGRGAISGLHRRLEVGTNTYHAQKKVERARAEKKTAKVAKDEQAAAAAAAKESQKAAKTREAGRLELDERQFSHEKAVSALQDIRINGGVNLSAAVKGAVVAAGLAKARPDGTLRILPKGRQQLAAARRAAGGMEAGVRRAEPKARAAVETALGAERQQRAEEAKKRAELSRLRKRAEKLLASRSPESRKAAIQALKLHAEGLGATEIGAKLGKNTRWVTRALREGGVTPRAMAKRIPADSALGARIEELYSEGKSIHEVGEIVGARPGQVHAVLTRRGATIRTKSEAGQRLTEEQKEKIGERYKEGDSVDALSEFYDFGRSTIINALKALGVYKPGKKGKPDKLSKQQKSEIAKRYEDGESISQMSADYGVGRPAIYRVLKALGLHKPGEAQRRPKVESITRGAELRGLLKSGLSVEQVAERTGLTAEEVTAQAAKVETTSENQRRELAVQLFMQGATAQEIAADLGRPVSWVLTELEFSGAFGHLGHIGARKRTPKPLTSRAAETDPTDGEVIARAHKRVWEDRLGKLFNTAGGLIDDPRGLNTPPILVPRSSLMSLLYDRPYSNIYISEKHGIFDAYHNKPMPMLKILKLLPEWLEDPAAVFKDETREGIDTRIKVIAPLTVGQVKVGDSLSGRFLEVDSLLAKGKSTSEVATLTGLSEKDVKNLSDNRLIEIIVETNPKRTAGRDLQPTGKDAIAFTYNARTARDIKGFADAGLMMYLNKEATRAALGSKGSLVQTISSGSLPYDAGRQRQIVRSHSDLIKAKKMLGPFTKEIYNQEMDARKRTPLASRKVSGEDALLRDREELNDEVIYVEFQADAIRDMMPELRAAYAAGVVSKFDFERITNKYSRLQPSISKRMAMVYQIYDELRVYSTVSAERKAVRKMTNQAMALGDELSQLSYDIRVAIGKKDVASNLGDIGDASSVEADQQLSEWLSEYEARLDKEERAREMQSDMFDDDGAYSPPAYRKSRTRGRSTWGGSVTTWYKPPVVPSTPKALKGEDEPVPAGIDVNDAGTLSRSELDAGAAATLVESGETFHKFTDANEALRKRLDEWSGEQELSISEYLSVKLKGALGSATIVRGKRFAEKGRSGESFAAFVMNDTDVIDLSPFFEDSTYVSTRDAVKALAAATLEVQKTRADKKVLPDHIPDFNTFANLAYATIWSYFKDYNSGTRSGFGITGPNTNNAAATPVNAVHPDIMALVEKKIPNSELDPYTMQVPEWGKQVMAETLQRLVDNGMPLAWITNNFKEVVTSIDLSTMPAMYDEWTGRVMLDRTLLWNAATNVEDARAAILHAMSHEIGHSVSVIDAPHSTAARAGPFVVLPGAVTVTNAGHYGTVTEFDLNPEKMGFAMRELTRVYFEGKMQDYDPGFLGYPLAGLKWKSTVGVPIHEDGVNELALVSEETWAQAVGHVFAFPEVARERIPQTYAFIQEVARESQSATDKRQVNQGLLRAVRASADASLDGDGDVYPEMQGGFGVKRASTGVAKPVVSEPALDAVAELVSLTPGTKPLFSRQKVRELRRSIAEKRASLKMTTSAADAAYEAGRPIEGSAPKQVAEAVAAAVEVLRGLNIGYQIVYSPFEDANVRRLAQDGVYVDNIRGWANIDSRSFIGDDGYILLATRNIKNAEDAVKVLMHEAVGHYGLRSMLGEQNYARWMDIVIRDFGSDVAKTAVRAGLIDSAGDFNKLSIADQRLAAEEYIAYTVESLTTKDGNISLKKRTFIQKFVDFIRELFGWTAPSERMRRGEKGFGGAKMTEADLHALIGRAHEYVKRARPTDGSTALPNRTQILASRAAANNMFYSKMMGFIDSGLDASGSPMRTPEDMRDWLVSMAAQGKFKTHELLTSGALGFVDTATVGDLFVLDPATVSKEDAGRDIDEKATKIHKNHVLNWLAQNGYDMVITDLVKPGHETQSGPHDVITDIIADAARVFAATDQFVVRAQEAAETEARSNLRPFSELPAEEFASRADDTTVQELLDAGRYTVISDYGNPTPPPHLEIENLKPLGEALKEKDEYKAVADEVKESLIEDRESLRALLNTFLRRFRAGSDEIATYWDRGGLYSFMHRMNQEGTVSPESRLGSLYYREHSSVYPSQALVRELASQEGPDSPIGMEALLVWAGTGTYNSNVPSTVARYMVALGQTVMQPMFKALVQTRTLRGNARKEAQLAAIDQAIDSLAAIEVARLIEKDPARVGPHGVGTGEGAGPPPAVWAQSKVDLSFKFRVGVAGRMPPTEVSISVRRFLNGELQILTRDVPFNVTQERTIVARTVASHVDSLEDLLQTIQNAVKSKVVNDPSLAEGGPVSDVVGEALRLPDQSKVGAASGLDWQFYTDPTLPPQAFLVPVGSFAPTMYVDRLTRSESRGGDKQFMVPSVRAWKGPTLQFASAVVKPYENVTSMVSFAQPGLEFRAQQGGHYHQHAQKAAGTKAMRSFNVTTARGSPMVEIVVSGAKKYVVGEAITLGPMKVGGLSLAGQYPVAVVIGADKYFIDAGTAATEEGSYRFEEPHRGKSSGLTHARWAVTGTYTDGKEAPAPSIHVNELQGDAGARFAEHRGLTAKDDYMEQSYAQLLGFFSTVLGGDSHPKYGELFRNIVNLEIYVEDGRDVATVTHIGHGMAVGGLVSLGSLSDGYISLGKGPYTIINVLGPDSYEIGLDDVAQQDKYIKPYKYRNTMMRALIYSKNAGGLFDMAQYSGLTMDEITHRAEKYIKNARNNTGTNYPSGHENSVAIAVRHALMARGYSPSSVAVQVLIPAIARLSSAEAGDEAIGLFGDGAPALLEILETDVPVSLPAVIDKMFSDSHQRAAGEPVPKPFPGIVGSALSLYVESIIKDGANLSDALRRLYDNVNKSIENVSYNITHAAEAGNSVLRDTLLEFPGDYRFTETMWGALSNILAEESTLELTLEMMVELTESQEIKAQYAEVLEAVRGNAETVPDAGDAGLSLRYVANVGAFGLALGGYGANRSVFESRLKEIIAENGVVGGLLKMYRDALANPVAGPLISATVNMAIATHATRRALDNPTQEVLTNYTNIHHDVRRALKEHVKKVDAIIQPELVPLLSLVAGVNSVMRHHGDYPHYAMSGENTALDVLRTAMRWEAIPAYPQNAVVPEWLFNAILGGQFVDSQIDNTRDMTEYLDTYARLMTDAVAAEEEAVRNLETDEGVIHPTYHKKTTEATATVSVIEGLDEATVTFVSRTPQVGQGVALNKEVIAGGRKVTPNKNKVTPVAVEGNVATVKLDGPAGFTQTVTDEVVTYELASKAKPGEVKTTPMTKEEAQTENARFAFQHTSSQYTMAWDQMRDLMLTMDDIMIRAFKAGAETVTLSPSWPHETRWGNGRPRWARVTVDPDGDGLHIELFTPDKNETAPTDSNKSHTETVPIREGETPSAALKRAIGTGHYSFPELNPGQTYETNTLVSSFSEIHEKMVGTHNSSYAVRSQGFDAIYMGGIIEKALKEAAKDLKAKYNSRGRLYIARGGQDITPYQMWSALEVTAASGNQNTVPGPIHYDAEHNAWYANVPEYRSTEETKKLLEEGKPVTQLFSRKEETTSSDSANNRADSQSPAPGIVGLDVTAQSSRDGKQRLEEASEVLAQEISDAGTASAALKQYSGFLNSYKRWKHAPNLPSTEDLGWYGRTMLHPRTMASLYPEFTPVWKSREAKFEMRDEIASELFDVYRPYHELTPEERGPVDLALQHGRMTRSDWTDTMAERLAKNPSSVFRLRNSYGKIKNLLGQTSDKGDVIELSPKQQNAYIAVRTSMERALMMLRNQMLSEIGIESVVVEGRTIQQVIALIERVNDAPLAPSKKAEVALVLQIAEDIDGVRNAGYIPYSRFGDYGVRVTDRQGNTAHFEMVDTDWMGKGIGRKLNRGRVAQLISDLKEQYPAKEGYRIEGPFEMGKEFIKMDNVTMGDIDLLAQLGNVDEATWKNVRENFELALKKRGFKKHFIRASEVPGYTLDFQRAIADYIMGFANYISSRATREQAENALLNIPATKPVLVKYAKDYIEYTDTATEELQRLRMITFLYYVGTNVSSILINSTQVPVVTAPYLSQFAPAASVAQELAVAYKEATKMLTKDPVGKLLMFDLEKAPEDVRVAMSAAASRGLLVPQASYHQMGVAASTVTPMRASTERMVRVGESLATLYSAQERLNRIVTFIAVMRLAKKHPDFLSNMNKVLSRNALYNYETMELGNMSPAMAARWAIDETHYRMGKINRPKWMRGVGASIFQFWSFTLNTIELLYRFAKLHGPEGKKALAMFAMMIFWFGGMLGMPGAENLRDLFEAMFKKLKRYDIDVEREFRLFMSQFPYGATGADVILRGPMRNLTGADMSRRVGMGRLYPVEVLTQGDISHALGIPFDFLIGRPSRAIDFAAAGQYSMAATEAMPNVVRNPVQAFLWGREGVRNRFGRDLLIPAEDISVADIVRKAIGFQPTNVSTTQERERSVTRARNAVRELQATYIRRIAKAEYMGNFEEAESLYEAVERHNEGKPDYLRIELTRAGLVRAMRQEAEAAQGRDRYAPRKSRDDIQQIREAWPPTDAEQERARQEEEAEEARNRRRRGAGLEPQTRDQLVASLREDGLPATAALISAMPAKLPAALTQQFEEALAI